MERNERLQTATDNIAALESGHKRLQEENDASGSEAGRSKSKLECLQSQHDEAATQIEQHTAVEERVEGEMLSLRNAGEALQASLEITTGTALDRLNALAAAERELQAANHTFTGLRKEVQECEATSSHLRGEHEKHIDTVQSHTASTTEGENTP